jgi:uncharacterized protein YkwD
MSLFLRVCAASLMLAVPVVLAQAPPRSSRFQSSQSIQAEAWRIVQLANQARAAAGTGPLKWDAALAAAARQHCMRMAAEGPLSHRYRGEPDTAERAARADAHFSLIEENVALGPDPATIHQQWMHSSGHRDNLLNPEVDRVGVAVVAGRRGLYAVADYARNVPLLTQMQVEAKVAGMVQEKGLAVQRSSNAAREACVADRGVPEAEFGARLRFIMRWQDADLSRLPRELTGKLASGQFRHAEVGSCPPQGQQGWFTAYRVAVLLD